MNFIFNVNNLFNLYLAPNLLLNDGVTIRATNSIIEKLPFISKLMKSKFKEGIVIINNNSDIDLKIPLIKLDVSSDFIKLIEDPGLFKGGDIGLYQDYLIAKGYGYSLSSEEIFDLENMDLKTYFDEYDGEIFDIYNRYFSDENRNRFILNMIISIDNSYLESNKKHFNKIDRFIMNFDSDTSFKNILITLNTFDLLFLSDNKADKFMSDLIIEKLGDSKFNKKLFLNLVKSTKDLVGVKVIKKEMLKNVYKNMNKELYILIKILNKYYPLVSVLEPDITNFFINLAHVKDLVDTRSLAKKLMNIYDNILITIRTRFGHLYQENIIIGITDTIIKYIPWKEFKQKSDFDNNFESFHDILSYNIDHFEMFKSEKSLNKIKDLVLKLFSVLSPKDSWTENLIKYFNFRIEYGEEYGEDEYEKLNILKDKMRILLEDDIIKMATLKGVDHSKIKKIINFFEIPILDYYLLD